MVSSLGAYHAEPKSIIIRQLLDQLDSLKVIDYIPVGWDQSNCGFFEISEELKIKIK